jgi:hypothetical protein
LTPCHWWGGQNIILERGEGLMSPKCRCLHPCCVQCLPATWAESTARVSTCPGGGLPSFHTSG